MKIPILLILGSLLLAGIHVSAATLYVSTASTNPLPPYATWTTAATNIQAAVNSAEAGDFIVVTDGVYYGGITVSNSMTLLSVNGANNTAISGPGLHGQMFPCITLLDGAMMVGFSVINGRNTELVAGVSCASSNVILINCVISNNECNFGVAGVSGGTLYNCTITENNGDLGNGDGGVARATLNNCTIIGNAGFDAGGADECTLNYCTLTGNGVEYTGGGALNCTLNNCVILGNGTEYQGGGAYGCILNNCLVCNNGAGGGGGGACVSSLTNCTIIGNGVSGGTMSQPVSGGGGVLDCTLNNCISYFNSAPAGYPTNYDTNSVLNYCCTTPLPASGIGNITNNALLVNVATNNFQLQSNSPCINAGNNAYVTSSTDVVGNPRIVGGTVDMGAYECQTPTSDISYAYLQEYNLPIDGSVDSKDLDGSGFDVFQDWVAGLNPTNRASVLAMLPPAATNNLAGITVRWKSVNGIQYLLQRSTNLTVPPVFLTIQENIPGQGGTNSYQDPSATNKTPYFYRVGVLAP